jgi:chromosome segregation ATPase
LFNKLLNNYQVCTQIQKQITIAQSDISQLNNQTSDIYNRLEDANQTIYQLQIQNAEAVQEIDQLETELVETKVELTTALNLVTTQLDEALVIIETMRTDIEAQDRRIAALESTTYEFQERMQTYEIENRNLWDAVQDLREDLDAIDQETEEEAQLREIKSKLTSAKLIIEQHRAKLNK